METIARLIETVRPKMIAPMHTEKADEFTSIPAFAPYRDRVRALTDGEELPLNDLWTGTQDRRLTAGLVLREMRRYV